MFGHDDQLQNPAAGQAAPDSAMQPTDGQDANGPALNMNELANGFTDTPVPPTMTTPAEPSVPAPASAPIAPAAPTLAGTEQLLDIKQQALQQLSPLVGHLDQAPEEKFRTTMMMIQASDNDSLIKTAYEAALQIADEKVRAQALLDIVNEINYFTHRGNASGPAA